MDELLINMAEVIRKLCSGKKCSSCDFQEECDRIFGKAASIEDTPAEEIVELFKEELR